MADGESNIPDPVAVERTYQRYARTSASTPTFSSYDTALIALHARRNYLDVLIALLEVEQLTARRS